VQQVQDKRNKIHSITKAKLEDHFIKHNIDTPDKKKEWVEYFLATGAGPVVYEDPIPQGGVWSSHEAGYKVCILCIFIRGMSTVSMFAPSASYRFHKKFSVVGCCWPLPHVQ
jgi:hypothetical protein